MKKREMILEKAFEDVCETLSFIIGKDKTSVMADYWARAEHMVADSLTDNQKNTLKKKLETLTEATHHDYHNIVFDDELTLLYWTDHSGRERVDRIWGQFVSYPVNKNKMYNIEEWLG